GAGASAFSNTNFASTRTPFVQWQLNNFAVSQLTNPAVAGPGADPDADGLENFVEYTFHRAPLSADLDRPGEAALERLPDQLDYFSIHYSRNKAAIDA